MSAVVVPSNLLNKETFTFVKLKEVKDYNHNTKLFVFELGEADKIAEFAISSFVLLKYFDTKLGQDVIRPYTPINTEDLKSKGLLNLLVKVYPNAAMSAHLFSLVSGLFKSL